MYSSNNPPLKQLNESVRSKMKATFEAAKETNRSVYYHFEGEPVKSVINKLYEYSNRYDVKVIIDTKLLN
nr:MULTISPECIES: restriction endonuclease fold toxin [unclassified Gilliamella]